MAVILGWPVDPINRGGVAAAPPNAGMRAIIHVAVTRVADSCGYSVPFFEHRAPP